MSVRRSIAQVALCLMVTAVLLPTFIGCGGAKTSGAPEVWWYGPSEGSEVYGIARLKADASADEGVATVEFYYDSVDDEHFIGSVDTPSGSLYMHTWYTTDVENGEHTLYAVVLDEKNESAQASRTVIVANLTRDEAIAAAVTWPKWTTQMDTHPPVLSASFYNYYYNPEPLGRVINTAGAEDSPFITPDGNTLYFFFTPDMNLPPEQQVSDRVTGIYWSKKVEDVWSEPQRIWLCDGLSLDGAETIIGNTMWFGSVRAGNSREIDIYTAELVNGVWSNWTNVGEPLNVAYDVGELHVSADGNQIYFHSERPGGKGKMDIWVTSRVNGQWQTPQNVDAVNSQYDDGYPYLSNDGNELWFTRNYGVYRSVKAGGQWQMPEVVVSSLAGEPTLDSQGNLYFVHHYSDAAGKLWEADIYVCRRR
jgi:hypothetical protein